MSKKEYLSSASKKIYNYNEKKNVEDELDSHISERIEYWKEIGYDDEAAEQKALESMGDAELISEELGQLHNDSYSPIFDIIYIGIWAIMLAGIYYLLNKFVFGDAGAISLDICAMFIGIAFALGHTSTAIKREQWQATLLSTIATIGTGVYLYTIIQELNHRFAGDVDAFVQYLLHSAIHNGSNYPPKNLPILILGIIMVLISLGLIVALINQVKIATNTNTLFDNKIKNISKRITRYFAILSFAIAAIFGAKYFVDVNTLYNEYMSAQSTALEIAEECDSKKDIYEYVKNSDLSFEEVKDKYNKTKQYIFKSNYSVIEISFEQSNEDEEIAEPKSDEMMEIAQIYENTVKELMSRPIIKQTISIIDKRNSVTKTKTIYTIYVNSDVTEYKNKYNSISLKKLTLSDKDEDKLRSFVPYNKDRMNYQKDFYTTIMPSNLSIQKRNRIGQDIYNFEYHIKYMNTYYIESRKFSSSIPSENEFYKKRDSIIKTIKKNPTMSYSEIAKATGCKLKKPSFSANEFINELGYSYAKKDKKDTLKSAYDELVVFKINDEWAFSVIGNPAKCVQFYHYDKMGGLFYDIQAISDKYAQSTTTIYNLGKTTIRGYYFDRLGKCYTSPERVPCYTSDGAKLEMITITEHTGDPSIGDIKTDYFSDNRSIYYELDKCYIDEDGYLVYSPGKLEKRKDGYYYTSSNKKYVSAKSASWNEHGKMLEIDESTSNFIDKFID